MCTRDRKKIADEVVVEQIRRMCMEPKDLIEVLYNSNPEDMHLFFGKEGTADTALFKGVMMKMSTIARLN